MSDSLTDRRVLVVEDEFLIAMLVEGILTDLGCEVVGPAGVLDTAMRLARDELLDVAILDVSIRGGSVFPVADILLGRRIPFVLASGYGDWALPEAFQGQARLNKPFRSSDVESAVRAACRPH